MTNDELNQYILHYLTEDKTNSAIMLTGDWGTGKSYYIQHSLKPFLEADENGKHQCIVVSLYGLKDTAEISKSIYLGTRLNFLNVTSEKATTAKFAGKTIVKGVAGFFGVDLSKDAEELQQLYESVDLTGKLIVLEDLERSGIDILEALGYVNNLVEQDNVKVLLVANEHKISSTASETKEQQITTALLEGFSAQEDSKSEEPKSKYAEIKEKTVSDTIVYEGNTDEAIAQIIKSFECEELSAIADKYGTSKIAKECWDLGVTNLRTLIFACQKAKDIFQQIKLSFSENEDYLCTVFFGILAFSQKIKSGEKTSWEGGANYSMVLGTDEYPLFRSCYDYIMWHSFDDSRSTAEKDALNDLRLFDEDKSRNDKDLQTVYDWWQCSEKEVLDAINSISERLKNEKDISFYEYGKIAVYFVSIKHVLQCNIDEAKVLLVENLHNKGDRIGPDYFVRSTFTSNEDPEVIAEIKDLRDAMLRSLTAKDTTIFGFDYQPESISAFNDNTIQKHGFIIRDKAFASRLNVDSIIAMLKKCTVSQLFNFRAAFNGVYDSANIGEFLSEDRPTLEKVRSRLKTELLNYESFDKIQKKHIEWFINNLTEIIDKL